MVFWVGIVQILTCLILLKVSHVVYWNLRKVYFIHPLFLDIMVALVLVLVFHFVGNVWGLVIITSIVLGLIRGDQEFESTGNRQLL